MVFEQLQFQGDWRAYQARVLEELSRHLDDDHLHIVAAPGSGKTILGLEVMRQLGKPTVILAPSLAIRNQWIDRLASMFIADKTSTDWISTDIRAPKPLTVITYQALHAAFTGEKDENDDEADEEEEDRIEADTDAQSEATVFAELKAQNIQTLVLDEAHHLRKAWWTALTELKAGLEDPTIVALTATPPYDVDQKEWEKYEALCGPIDAEISVPELVKRSNLCPHQDYVYFSLPIEKEAKTIARFKGDMQSLLSDLKTDQTFFDLLASHPWVADMDNQVENILSAPKFFSSIIIFLNAAGFETPKKVLGLLGVRRASDIPELNSEWLEELLTGTLYTHEADLSEHAETIDVLRRRLKRIGAIERRKVTLSNTKDIQTLLAGSLGKLDSIVKITRAEHSNLGGDLRMVILSDYIRKSAMPSDANETQPVEKIGVVPIFEYIRRAKISGIRLGVLTGSLVIIPKEAQPLLEATAKQMGIDTSNLRLTELVYDDTYIRVEIEGAERQNIVQLITEVFNAGGVSVLVGTQALLGEGWDAPTINTLVLASYVGSYMLSNQMRGRAIRIDPDRPEKVANVWHLVAVDLVSVDEIIQSILTGETNRKTTFSVFDDIKKDLGQDIYTLRRRFRAFEGVSYHTPPTIETGFKRLGLGKAKWTVKGIDALNRNMLDRAAARHRLPDQWAEALQGSSPKPEMREQVRTNAVPSMFTFFNTLKYMVITALMTGAYYVAEFLNGGNSRFFLFSLVFGLLVASVIALPGLIKALYLTLKHGSLEGRLKQVGWVTVETLQHMDLIKTAKQNLRVEAVQDQMGVSYCRLSGATRVERNHFNEAMTEVLGATENPRYLIVRTESFFGLLKQIDYHPVPSTIGRKKATAEMYAKRWKQYVGKCKLVYTRQPEGRLELLSARTHSLASAFQKKADRLSVWE